MAFPDRIEPMEPTTGRKLVDKPDWYYEPKMDGFRAMVYVDDGTVRMHSRQYNNFLKGAISETLSPQLSQIPHSTILDGEIIAEDENGHPDFWTLATSSNEKLTTVPISLVCFDIVQFDDLDLRTLPLKERRLVLKKLLQECRLPNVQCIHHEEGLGTILFNEVIRLGLEGIVAKDSASPYVGGKTKLWQKFKDPEYVKKEMEWRKKFNQKPLPKDSHF